MVLLEERVQHPSMHPSMHARDPCLHMLLRGSLPQEGVRGHAVSSALSFLWGNPSHQVPILSSCGGRAITGDLTG